MAYATVDDLADWYRNKPTPMPDDPEGRLARASERIDEALIGVIYDVDDGGMPTAPADVDALKRATCAQVEYMALGRDETGALSAFTSVSAGGVSYSRNVSAGGSALASSPSVGPQAASILRVAGLTTVTAISPYGY